MVNIRPSHAIHQVDWRPQNGQKRSFQATPLQLLDTFGTHVDLTGHQHWILDMFRPKSVTAILIGMSSTSKIFKIIYMTS